MAKICCNCGKKINYFSAEPFTINSEKVLCDICSTPIELKVKRLSTSYSLTDFIRAKEDILNICLENYNVEITQAIEQYIDSIANTRIFNDDKIKAEYHKKELLKNHLLTTGYDFAGYKISDYKGVISGQVVLGTGFMSEISAAVADFFGESSECFAEKLETAKNAAVEKLILKSDEKGGNAIIGMDFDYITFSNNMIGVVANGTSVVIEKEQ